MTTDGGCQGRCRSPALLSGVHTLVLCFWFVFLWHPTLFALGSRKHASNRFHEWVLLAATWHNFSAKMENLVVSSGESGASTRTNLDLTRRELFPNITRSGKKPWPTGRSASSACYAKC